MEKHKLKRKGQTRSLWVKTVRFVIRATLIGLIAFLAFGMWAVYDFSRNIEFDWEGEEARTKAEELLDTALPAEATNFRMYYIRWQDWFAQIRFEIPAETGTNWTNDLACIDGNIANHNPPVLGSDSSLSWWHPETATNQISGSCGNNPYYRILIDQTDSTIWIVYISANTT